MNQKKEAQSSFLKDFTDNWRGKKIKFNHAYTESVEEEKEYNAKGKKYQKKMAALGLGVFVKDSPEQIAFHNLVVELSQCNDCHSDKIHYKAVFRLKMIHPENQKKWSDLKIVRIYDDKSSAASLRQNEPIQLKGKIKNIEIGDLRDYTSGRFIETVVREIEIE